MGNALSRIHITVSTGTGPPPGLQCSTDNFRDWLLKVFTGSNLKVSTESRIWVEARTTDTVEWAWNALRACAWRLVYIRTVPHSCKLPLYICHLSRNDKGNRLKENRPQIQVSVVRVNVEPTPLLVCATEGYTKRTWPRQKFP